MSQLPPLSLITGLLSTPGQQEPPNAAPSPLPMDNGQWLTIQPGKINNNYQTITRNDSGISKDSTKLQAMPGLYDWWPTEPYDELFDDDRNQATIHWEGPWSNRLEWKNWMLGYTNVISPTSSTFARTVPKQHPEMPWLYATDVKFVRGKGSIFNRSDLQAILANGSVPLGPDGLPLFDPMLAYGERLADGSLNDGHCIYAVTYRALDYDIYSDSELDSTGYKLNELGRYVTRLSNYAVKAIGLPPELKSSFQFCPADLSGFVPFTNLNVQMPQTPANLVSRQVTAAEIPIIQPIQQLEYIWHEVPKVPWTTLANCVGKVNSTEFDKYGKALFPMPATTLLCQTPKPHRYRTKTGATAYRIHLRFDFLATGWNRFPGVDSNGNFGYWPATFGGKSGARGLYETADFNQIFNPSFN